MHRGAGRCASWHRPASPNTSGCTLCAAITTATHANAGRSQPPRPSRGGRARSSTRAVRSGSGSTPRSRTVRVSAETRSAYPRQSGQPSRWSSSSRSWAAGSSSSTAAEINSRADMHSTVWSIPDDSFPSIDERWADLGSRRSTARRRLTVGGGSPDPAPDRRARRRPLRLGAIHRRDATRCVEDVPLSRRSRHRRRPRPGDVRARHRIAAPLPGRRPRPPLDPHDRPAGLRRLDPPAPRADAGSSNVSPTSRRRLRCRASRPSSTTCSRLLDHDRRAAFVTTQVLGLRYDEAAELLGCPIGTIRSRVARAGPTSSGSSTNPARSKRRADRELSSRCRRPRPV